MRFMLHHHARCAVVIVVSLAMFSAGCRSTRNGLARVPGMGWMASDEVESFPGWDGDSQEAGLPAPSENATPQVVSDGETRTLGDKPGGGYPTTGYASPYDDSTDVAGAGSYPTGEVGPGSYSKAAVGKTQQGFYDETYASGDDPAVSDPAANPNDYGSSDPYGDYASPYGAPGDYQTDSVAADADPSFERLGQSTPDAGEDSYRMDPTDGLDTAAGYDRLKDDVGEFARDQVDNLRDSVENGYDTVSETARDAYNAGIESAQNAIDNAYGGDDRLPSEDSDLGNAPTFDPPANGYSDFESDAYDATTPQDLAPQADGSTASLNPSYGDESTGQNQPRRTPRPWRPGSTGSFGQTDDNQSHYSKPLNQIVPASYPMQDRVRVPENTSDYPSDGWQSEANSQRLTPSYR